MGTKGQRDAGTAVLLPQHLSRKDKSHSSLFTPSSLTACRDEDISMLLLTLCKYCSTCLAKYCIFFPSREKIPVAMWSVTVPRQVQSLRVSLTRVHFLELFFILAGTRSLSCKCLPGRGQGGVPGAFPGVAQPLGREPAGRTDPAWDGMGWGSSAQPPRGLPQALLPPVPLLQPPSRSYH